MQLIGMLDSPFVRRAAITMRMLDVSYEHKPLSIFQTYEEFRQLNPLVKVPTLLCDDGEMLVDSTLIIDYIESLAGRSLMPVDPLQRRVALQRIGVALVAMEKVAQRIYELKVRPEEYRYEPWLERLNEQLLSAIDAMELSVGEVDDNWMFGEQPSQADITTAVAWRFVNHAAPAIAGITQRPALDEFSSRAEKLPEFLACPLE
jgi:glutathione S-transferase